jgi:hypothetical protein
MKTIYTGYSKGSGHIAILLAALLSLPIVGCGGSKNASAPPPVDDTHGGTMSSTAPVASPTQQKKGLNNLQKGAIVLVGAAALYYLYRQHQKKAAEGPNGKYYLSKNGRVYYRDAQHRAHYVTPPPGGVQVPASEAQQYRDFRGYNGDTSRGRDLTGLGTAPVQQ